MCRTSIDTEGGMDEDVCGCGKPWRYMTPSGNACNKYARCQSIREEGPWIVSDWRNGRIAIQSDDFYFDAALEVSGDFGSPEIKKLYAEEICRRLNTTNPVTRSKPEGKL